MSGLQRASRDGDRLVQGDIDAARSTMSKHSNLLRTLTEQREALAREAKQLEAQASLATDQNRKLRQSLLEIQNKLAETEQMKARLEREATKLEQGIAKQSAELREVEDKIKGSIDATEKTTLRLARQQGRMNAVYGESAARVKTIMVRPEGPQQIVDLYLGLLSERGRLQEDVKRLREELEKKVQHEEQQELEYRRCQERNQEHTQLTEERNSLRGTLDELDNDIRVLKAQVAAQAGKKASASTARKEDATPFATLHA